MRIFHLTSGYFSVPPLYHQKKKEKENKKFRKNERKKTLPLKIPLKFKSIKFQKCLVPKCLKKKKKTVLTTLTIQIYIFL